MLIEVCGSVITRLVNRRAQTSKGKQFIGGGESVYVIDFTKYYSAVDITDIWNGHDNGIIEFYDVRHFSFNTFQLAIL